MHNGTPVGEGTTLSLNPAIFSVGDTIECHAMVADETGATDTDIVSTIVSNTAPQILEPATISSSSGAITTNSTLTCSANFVDLNDGTLSIDYTWINGSQTISKDATLHLDSTYTNPNDAIECTALAVDTNGAKLKY